MKDTEKVMMQRVHICAKAQSEFIILRFNDRDNLNFLEKSIFFRLQ